MTEYFPSGIKSFLQFYKKDKSNRKYGPETENYKWPYNLELKISIKLMTHHQYTNQRLKKV